ncbi:hypothetical protein JZ751_029402 [Albula glossodonta]|uniref:Uncharacterized protein n=1 Tax=Albula glossodonta TaxID=121402 RepID=A0A8T2PHI7_9TELE|nr:hypothetical protein JZ751_029402 [Albula glossodonta]
MLGLLIIRISNRSVGTAVASSAWHRLASLATTSGPYPEVCASRTEITFTSDTYLPVGVGENYGRGTIFKGGKVKEKEEEERKGVGGKGSYLLIHPGQLRMNTLACDLAQRHGRACQWFQIGRGEVATHVGRERALGLRESARGAVWQLDLALPIPTLKDDGCHCHAPRTEFWLKMGFGFPGLGFLKLGVGFTGSGFLKLGLGILGVRFLKLGLGFLWLGFVKLGLGFLGLGFVKLGLGFLGVGFLGLGFLKLGLGFLGLGFLKLGLGFLGLGFLKLGLGFPGLGFLKLGLGFPALGFLKLGLGFLKLGLGFLGLGFPKFGLGFRGLGFAQ